LEKYIGLIASSELFAGIEPADALNLLGCLGAEQRRYSKGSVLISAGDAPAHFGIALEGRLLIVRDGFDGNRSLLAVIEPGGAYAEALVWSRVKESPVTVLAETDCAVILFNFSKTANRCKNSCPFHGTLIENMLASAAKKILALQGRMEILEMKAIREKVLRYLESFNPVRGKRFTVPLNREKLAEYLCTDRSALSHELARMKRDGIIDYKKNSFVLI